MEGCKNDDMLPCIEERQDRRDREYECLERKEMSQGIERGWHTILD